ncbi:MAG: hypothetical protein NT167_22445 [Verrucomicrobia bacterium]|nr:hypothetical protein [Verrucomicrobiota bacterium]
MITDLLWRCPLCATNDALMQQRRLFRPPQLRCRHCGTTWQVRRVIGDDYWLKVIASPATQEQVGRGRPLAQWYARLKETVALAPIEATSVPSHPAVTLGDGERLYLASRTVRLAAEAGDPLFFGGADTDTPHDRKEMGSARVGQGRLLLTNQRLMWQGVDGRQVDFALDKLNSAYATFNVALVLLYGMRLYSVRFTQESLLKWITYFAYVAKEIKAASGHLITTSNY